MIMLPSPTWTFCPSSSISIIQRSALISLPLPLAGEGRGEGHLNHVSSAPRFRSHPLPGGEGRGEGPARLDSLLDLRLELMPEMLDHRAHRHRRGVAQRADGAA